MSDNNRDVIMDVRNLKKYFHLGRHQILKAVDDVSFQIREGETLGLAGESGCGKTTCGRTMINLYDKTDGFVYYRGKDVHTLQGPARKAFTKEVQVVFQDPYASLNPRMTVGDIVAEGIDIHNLAGSAADRRDRIYSLLELVGLAKEHANRFAHEFSGGQRQRIGIARALAVEPKFIVLDEPISALDVSIQAQIVNLLTRLQRKMGLTYMFVVHDLSMLQHMSDNIAIMYLGTIVEMMPAGEFYEYSLHPYTKALLSAIPIPSPDVERTRQRIKLQGDVPSPINPPDGCRFKDRCSMSQKICGEQMPHLAEVSPKHFVACHIIK